jgi:Cysteine-rich secretory protein family
VGIEDRDWYREGSEHAAGHTRSRGTSPWRIVVGVLLGLALVAMLSRPAYDRERGANGLRIELFPGSPGITLGEQPLYPENDPWSAWLADERTCPGGEDVSLPPALQVQVMLCLLNFARAHEGLDPVVLSPFLSRTADSKARDIVLCRDFSHEACGKQPFQAASELGYAGSLGENLYVGEGPLMAPRPAVDTWLNSQGHRENLFQPAWRTVGISLLAGATLDEVEDGVVWVNHFGQ